MAEETQDEELGQEIVLDEDSTETTDEDRSQGKSDNMSEKQIAEAADRVQSGEDDLDDYSKNVQKRIKNLTQKYREAERQSQEAATFAQQLLEENKQLKGRMEKLDSGYLTEYGARIESQIGAARRSYKEAYDSGDTDAMIEAQEALARATTEKDRYEMAKRRADQQREARPAPEQWSQAPVQQGFQQQPQQPQPDPKAQGWADKNEWFGQDEVMTYAAFGIHRKLVEEEGFDPTSDEYYNEIDRRMRTEFPHKFSAQKSGRKNQVASAGASASRSTKQGRRSVKLSPSQIAIAKKLNVPLEEYAKYVKE